jgi:hypothetical protein
MSGGSYQISTRDLYNQVFGGNYHRVYVMPQNGLEASQQTSPQKMEVDLPEGADGVGLLGLPIWGTINFPNGEYTYNGQRVQYEGLKLTDCVADISQQKTIVSTAIAGRNGAVRELISANDYVITIKGFLVSTDKYKEPDELIRKLNALFQVPAALRVESAAFTRLGIYSVVLESLSLNKKPGVLNAQPFELSAVSDLPIELLINQEELL